MAIRSPISPVKFANPQPDVTTLRENPSVRKVTTGMPLTANPTPLVRDAEALARRLLAQDSDRFVHSSYAASIADVASDALGVDDRDAIIAAAWLHDVGHLPAMARTGFHALDGALFLAAEGWPESTVRLVAHHSHANVLAPYFGVDDQLCTFDHVPSEADDILTYADLCSGPTGMGSLPQQRITEMRADDADTQHVPEEIREGRYQLLLSAAERVSAAMRAQPSGWSGRRRPRATSLSGSRLAG